MDKQNLAPQSVRFHGSQTQHFSVNIDPDEVLRRKTAMESFEGLAPAAPHINDNRVRIFAILDEALEIFYGDLKNPGFPYIGSKEPVPKA